MLLPPGAVPAGGADWGEQAPASAQATSPEEREKLENVQKELKNLSERQKKIGDITDNIYKGKNK